MPGGHDHSLELDFVENPDPSGYLFMNCSLAGSSLDGFGLLNHCRG